MMPSAAWTARTNRGVRGQRAPRRAAVACNSGRAWSCAMRVGTAKRVAAQRSSGRATRLRALSTASKAKHSRSGRSAANRVAQGNVRGAVLVMSQRATVASTARTPCKRKCAGLKFVPAIVALARGRSGARARALAVEVGRNARASSFSRNLAVSCARLRCNGALATTTCAPLTASLARSHSGACAASRVDRARKRARVFSLLPSTAASAAQRDARRARALTERALCIALSAASARGASARLCAVRAGYSNAPASLLGTAPTVVTCAHTSRSRGAATCSDARLRLR